jgi:PAS domain S-box-containing protein
VIGVISVQAYLSYAYGEEERLLLTTIADQMSMAVEKARLYDQAQQEIAERKRVEEALRESEERYRRLVEISPDGIVVHSEGKAVFVNAVGLELVGAESLDQVIGRPVMDFVHPGYREIAAKRIQQALQAGELPPPIHEKFIRLDGTFLDVEVTGTPFVYQDRPAMLLVVRDITERIRSEEALRESEERYRTLVNQAPIGVFTCDCEGTITHVNPALLQVLGSASEEAARQFNMLTMPNLVEAGIAADILRCMEEAIPITDEYRYHSYWGRESICRVRLTPLRDESGAVSGALGTVEDVTEQRRLQEQLVHSAKLASIGELAAGVAHEINNPINGIINYAQLLLNQVEDDSRQARFLEGILREGDRVASIVRDLLTFARVEKDAHSPASVLDILRVTLALSGQQLKKDGIILVIQEQPGLPQIKCRSQRIQQVFLNLISNARDALNARYPGNDPNKRLVIRIEEIEKDGRPHVRTTFHDQGEGISAHNLARIFTPFFTTKRPDEGTGLGLSVSYGIVHDHRGDILVESVEGEYTIFRVDLPVDPGWEV